MTEEKQTTALAKVMPVTVYVGHKYEMLVHDKVRTVRVEKIYKNESGDEYILITIYQGLNSCFKKTTAPIRVSDFKERMVGGGLSELEI